MANIQSDRRELALKQKRKAEKAGRFKDGFVLLETDNPLLTDKDTAAAIPLSSSDFPSAPDKRIRFHDVFNKSRAIKKWSDQRVLHPEAESIFSLEIPLLNDNWTATSPEFNISIAKDYTFRTNIAAKRKGAKLSLRLSFVHCPIQLKFFNN